MTDTITIHHDPISTTSRPVFMFAQEHDLPIRFELVSLMEGEHEAPGFRAINPCGRVPVLVDGEFILTQSNAILRYLAKKASSPAYPVERDQRARVDEALDFLLSDLHSVLGPQLAYQLLYPDMFGLSDSARAEVIAKGRALTAHYLAVLEDHYLGPRRNYCAGDQLTIADYVGGSMLLLLEAIDYDLAPLPNIRRWRDTLAARASWGPTTAAYRGHLSAMRPLAA